MTFTRIKMYHNGAYITEALFPGNNHVTALVRFHEIFHSASDSKVNLVAETVDVDTESDYFKSCLMITVKDLLSLEISIDVVDDVTDDLWIAFDGPITLTEEGKRRFASVLDLPVVVPGVSEDDGIHTIFLNGETACILINDQEDWERLERKCIELFEAMAGYCSESNWNKWFRF